jgi:hypothetical protein
MLELRMHPTPPFHIRSDLPYTDQDRHIERCQCFGPDLSVRLYAIALLITLDRLMQFAGRRIWHIANIRSSIAKRLTSNFTAPLSLSLAVVKDGQPPALQCPVTRQSLSANGIPNELVQIVKNSLTERFLNANSSAEASKSENQTNILIDVVERIRPTRTSRA